MEAGSSTLDVAGKIGPRLQRDAIAGSITLDGVPQTLDANQPLPDGCRLEILTRDDKSPASENRSQTGDGHRMFIFK